MGTKDRQFLQVVAGPTTTGYLRGMLLNWGRHHLEPQVRQGLCLRQLEVEACPVGLTAKKKDNPIPHHLMLYMDEFRMD